MAIGHRASFRFLMQKYCPGTNLRHLSYFASKSVNLHGPKVAWGNIETEEPLNAEWNGLRQI